MAPAPTTRALAGEKTPPGPLQSALVCRWQARRRRIAAAGELRSGLPPMPLFKGSGLGENGNETAYLCLKQVRNLRPERDSRETVTLQGFSEAEGWQTEDDSPLSNYQTAADYLETPPWRPPSPAVEAVVGATRLPAGKRWRGRLGPGLFMTAVEAAPPARSMREHGEALGRQARRLLRMTLEQRARNDLPPGLGTDPAQAEQRRPLIRDWAARAAAATALVPCAKSAQGPNPHGFNGLPASGRRSIKDAGAVLDEHYGSLGFFTATLTPETAATATRAQIAEFQTRLLFLLRRTLVRLGLPPLVLLVAEMHPGRRALDGAAVPHWHGVVKTAPAPFATWLFRKEQFNRCVLQAYRIAFGHRRGHVQRLQLLPQRTGSARYLAKYMSKASSDVRHLKGTQTGRMVPRQWWAWTGELRRMVGACRIRPPAAFLRWCIRWRHELVELGEVSTGDLRIGEDGALVGAWFGWRNEEALDRAIRTWIESEMLLIDRSTGPPGWALVAEEWEEIAALYAAEGIEPEEGEAAAA